MQDDAVGSSAATLLTQLLLHLKTDMIKDSGQSSFSSPLPFALSNAFMVSFCSRPGRSFLVLALPLPCLFLF